MPSTALLRIPRADDKDSCILVHATNTSSTQLLELTLTATEGERAFETKLKESELGLYKRKQFSRSLDDLRSIIQYVFQKTPSTDPALVEGLDIKADVEDDIITIRIGKHYSGISQQFAVFGIPQKDSAEISIFDWAADSCKALDEVNETLLLLQSSLAAKDATIKSLTNQLSELTDLKKKHEDLLLVKFSELLNSKKAKIRELTRELERSSLGRSEEPSPIAPAESEPEEAPPAKGRRKAAPKPAAPSRKRKPALPEPSSDEDDFGGSDADAGAGAMDLDTEQPESSTRSNRRSKVKSSSSETPAMPSSNLRNLRNTTNTSSTVLKPLVKAARVKSSAPSVNSSTSKPIAQVPSTQASDSDATNSEAEEEKSDQDQREEDDDDLPPPRPRIDWETGKIVASGAGVGGIRSVPAPSTGTLDEVSQVSHVSDTLGTQSGGKVEGMERILRDQDQDSDMTGDETD